MIQICSPSVAPDREIMPLTDAIIKAKKHDPYMRSALTDGDGLQLRISTKDKRSWSLQYRFNGRMQKLTLGNWPSISCFKARKLASDARYVIAKGIDPQAEKRKARGKRPTRTWRAWSPGNATTCRCARPGSTRAGG